jgi:hypothetical protein
MLTERDVESERVAAAARRSSVPTSLLLLGVRRAPSTIVQQAADVSSPIATRSGRDPQPQSSTASAAGRLEGRGRAGGGERGSVESRSPPTGGPHLAKDAKRDAGSNWSDTTARWCQVHDGAEAGRQRTTWSSYGDYAYHPSDRA